MIPYSYNITGNDLSPLNFPGDWNTSVKMGLKIPALSGSAYELLTDRFGTTNLSCKVFFTDGENYIVKRDTDFDAFFNYLFIEIPEQTVPNGNLTLLDISSYTNTSVALDTNCAVYKLTCNNFSLMYTGFFDLKHFYMTDCTINNFSICYREVAQVTPTDGSVFESFNAGEINITNSNFTNFHFLSYLSKAGGGSTRLKFNDCTFGNFYYDLVNDTSYSTQHLQRGTHGYGEFPITFTNCNFTNYYGIYIVSDAQKIVETSTNPSGMGRITFSNGTIPSTIYPICIESGSSALTKEQCAVYLGRILYTFEDFNWVNDYFCLLGKISNGYVTYYENSSYKDVHVDFNRVNFTGNIYLGGHITGNGHVDDGIGYYFSVDVGSTIGGDIYCGNKNETSSIITNGSNTIRVYGGTLNNIYGTATNTVSSNVNIFLYGGHIVGDISAKYLPSHSCNRFFVSIGEYTIQEREDLIIDGEIDGTVGASETSILKIIGNVNFGYYTTGFSELQLVLPYNVIVYDKDNLRGNIDVDSLKTVLVKGNVSINNIYTFLTFPKTYLTDQRVTYLKNNIVWYLNDTNNPLGFDESEPTFLKVEDSVDGLSRSIVLHYEVSIS